MAKDAFAHLDGRLAGRERAVRERFGIADAALFHVARRAPEQGLTLPAKVAVHLERVKARPAVARVRAIRDEA